MKAMRTCDAPLISCPFHSLTLAILIGRGWGVLVVQTQWHLLVALLGFLYHLIWCTHQPWRPEAIEMPLQVINPKKDLPVGLLGSLGVVTVLYVLMAATIVLIVPYTQIDPKAAFAAAFQVPSTFTCA